MVTKLIKIGNSFGVRIPKAILNELELGNEVEIKIINDFLAIRPVNNVRSNWDERFASVAREQTEILEFANEFDSKEWDW